MKEGKKLPFLALVGGGRGGVYMNKGKNMETEAFKGKRTLLWPRISRFIILLNLLFSGVWMIIFLYSLNLEAEEGKSAIIIQGESINFDGATRVAVVEGNVAVFYDIWRLTAQRGEYDEGKGEIRLFGGVKVEGQNAHEGTTFKAAMVTVFLDTRVIKAEGQVSASYDKVTLKGRTASFDLREEIFSAEGDVELMYRGEKDDESGDDIEATCGKALFFMKEERAILSGGPKVRRGGNVFTGQEMVIHLKEKKILASGGTRLEIEGVGL